MEKILRDPKNIQYEQFMFPKSKVDKLIETAIRLQPDVIKYINTNTEIQKLAITLEPTVIQYINNPSFEIQCFAISKYPFLIKYIGNPSETVCKHCLNIDPSVIRYLDQDKYGKYALDKDITSLRYIRNQTSDIIKYACDIDQEAVHYIYFEVIDIMSIKDIIFDVLERDPTLIAVIPQKYEFCLKAIEVSASSVNYINFLSNSLLHRMVELNPQILKYIEPDRDLCDHAFKHQTSIIDRLNTYWLIPRQYRTWSMLNILNY